MQDKEIWRELRPSFFGPIACQTDTCTEMLPPL
jgi:hypothetical protein